LRADAAVVFPGSGESASSWANLASACPSIAIRPLSWTDGSLPWSTQRRTVSSLTPKSAAASLIRKFGTGDSIVPQMRIVAWSFPQSSDGDGKCPPIRIG
jgi:hypothetical protein